MKRGKLEEQVSDKIYEWTRENSKWKQMRKRLMKYFGVFIWDHDMLKEVIDEQSDYFIELVHELEDMRQQEIDEYHDTWGDPLPSRQW